MLEALQSQGKTSADLTPSQWAYIQTGQLNMALAAPSYGGGDGGEPSWVVEGGSGTDQGSRQGYGHGTGAGHAGMAKKPDSGTGKVILYIAIGVMVLVAGAVFLPKLLKHKGVPDE